jgi:hypothetical protein
VKNITSVLAFLKSANLYILPSVAVKEKSGAFAPIFNVNGI